MKVYPINYIDVFAFKKREANASPFFIISEAINHQGDQLRIELLP